MFLLSIDRLEFLEKGRHLQYTKEVSDNLEFGEKDWHL